MKRALILVLAACITMNAAVTLGNHTIAGSTTSNNVTTTGIDSTGASVVWAAVVCLNTKTCTFSDSKSNIWTALTPQTLGITTLQLYCKVSPTTDALHTFTASSTGGYPAVAVEAFNGTGGASCPEQQNGATAPTTTTVNTGNVTLSSSGVFVTGVTIDNIVGETYSIDSSFAITDQITVVSGQHFSLAMGYLISAASTKNPKWTASNSGNMSTTMGTSLQATGTVRHRVTQ